MKSCKGCKNLVAFGAACKGDEQLTRHEDALTGHVVWRDDRYPGTVFRPSPDEMRVDGGRCGVDRKLYEPRLIARLMPWLYD